MNREIGSYVKVQPEQPKVIRKRKLRRTNEVESKQLDHNAKYIQRAKNAFVSLPKIDDINENARSLKSNHLNLKNGEVIQNFTMKLWKKSKQKHKKAIKKSKVQGFHVESIQDFLRRQSEQNKPSFILKNLTVQLVRLEKMNLLSSKELRKLYSGKSISLVSKFGRFTVSEKSETFNQANSATSKKNNSCNLILKRLTPKEIKAWTELERTQSDSKSKIQKSSKRYSTPKNSPGYYWKCAFKDTAVFDFDYDNTNSNPGYTSTPLSLSNNANSNSKEESRNKLTFDDEENKANGKEDVQTVQVDSEMTNVTYDANTTYDIEEKNDVVNKNSTYEITNCNKSELPKNQSGNSSPLCLEKLYEYTNKLTPDVSKAEGEGEANEEEDKQKLEENSGMLNLTYDAENETDAVDKNTTYEITSNNKFELSKAQSCNLPSPWLKELYESTQMNDNNVKLHPKESTSAIVEDLNVTETKDDSENTSIEDSDIENTLPPYQNNKASIISVSSYDSSVIDVSSDLEQVSNLKSLVGMITPKSALKLNKNKGTDPKRKVTFSNFSTIIISDSDMSVSSTPNGKPSGTPVPTNFLENDSSTPILQDFNKRGTIGATPAKLFHKEKGNKSGSPTKTKKSAKKVALKRTQIPNFALLHKKMFENMVDIKEHMDRKKKRAEFLLNSHKKKQEHSVSKLKKPDVKNSKLPTQAKLKTDPVFSLKKNKSNDMKKEAIKVIANKSKPPKSVTEKSKVVIQGVRSNKRFDLLMKMRQKK